MESSSSTVPHALWPCYLPGVPVVFGASHAGGGGNESTAPEAAWPAGTDSGTWCATGGRLCIYATRACMSASLSVAMFCHGIGGSIGLPSRRFPPLGARVLSVALQ